MKNSDIQVIRDCLEGNPEAFEILVNRYEAHVKALAWNISGNPEEAQEISQETFLQAFKNLCRFDINRDFKSWIMGITIKRSLDKLRKRKIFINFFNRYSQETFQAVEDIKPFEESPIFNPLLKQLKERERIALSLQINENYTAKEIGKILECSESSVRVILFKAKKRLRNILLANEAKAKTKKNLEVLQ